MLSGNTPPSVCLLKICAVLSYFLKTIFHSEIDSLPVGNHVVCAIANHTLAVEDMRRTVPRTCNLRIRSPVAALHFAFSFCPSFLSFCLVLHLLDNSYEVELTLTFRNRKWLARSGHKPDVCKELAGIRDTSFSEDVVHRETGFFYVRVHVYHACSSVLASFPQDSVRNRVAVFLVCSRKCHYQNRNSHWPFFLGMFHLCLILMTWSWKDFRIAGAALVS